MSGPWIKVLPEPCDDSELQRLYDENRAADGSVDHILTIHSLDPESLRAHLAVYYNAMRATSELSKAQREMIAVVASVINHCHY